MPTRTDESPPLQQDRASELGRTPHDELRSFDADPAEASDDHDARVSATDDPQINTHGSER
jgi:hypothetical protein